MRATGFVAKVFNCHIVGAAHDLASIRCSQTLRGISPTISTVSKPVHLQEPRRGPGQPWHQDAYYFLYDKQPQVTSWVALSRATLENGCLWVRRVAQKSKCSTLPTAGRACKAIRRSCRRHRRNPGDDGPATCSSSLLSDASSTGNVADYRRSAMVYRYAEAGTEPVDAVTAATLAHVNRWRARRAASIFSLKNGCDVGRPIPTAPAQPVSRWQDVPGARPLRRLTREVKAFDATASSSSERVQRCRADRGEAASTRSNRPEIRQEQGGNRG